MSPFKTDLEMGAIQILDLLYNLFSVERSWNSVVQTGNLETQVFTVSLSLSSSWISEESMFFVFHHSMPVAVFGCLRTHIERITVEQLHRDWWNRTTGELEDVACNKWIWNQNYLSIWHVTCVKHMTWQPSDISLFEALWFHINYFLCRVRNGLTKHLVILSTYKASHFFMKGQGNFPLA